MKQSKILVALVEPDKNVVLTIIENTLDAHLAVVSGPRIELFAVRPHDESLVGVCNEEFLFDGSPLNRFNLATRAWICGTYFVCGDRDGDEGREFCSLTKEQLLSVAYYCGCIENLDDFDWLLASTHQEATR